MNPHILTYTLKISRMYEINTLLFIYSYTYSLIMDYDQYNTVDSVDYGVNILIA